MCLNINYCAHKYYFARGSVIFVHFEDSFFHCFVSNHDPKKSLTSYFSASRNLFEKFLYSNFPFDPNKFII